MNVRVTYSTEAFLAKNEGQPGKQFELSFASLEEALAAPFPLCANVSETLPTL